MLGSVAMERNTQHTAQHPYWRFSVFVWNKVMQKGKDAFCPHWLRLLEFSISLAGFCTLLW